MAPPVDRRAGESLIPLVTAHYALTIETTARAEPAVGALGLTMALAHALWVIDPDETPSSMKTLAARLHCTAPSLTFLLDRLSEKGLVARGDDLSDRRVRTASLTPRRRAVREEVLAAIAAESPLASLDANERRSLLALLHKADRAVHT